MLMMAAEGSAPNSLSSRPPRRDETVFDHSVRAALVRRQRHLVVDQGIQRRLHIDLRIHHAGLLQRQAGSQD